MKSVPYFPTGIAFATDFCTGSAHNVHPVFRRDGGRGRTVSAVRSALCQMGSLRREKIASTGNRTPDLQS